MYVDIIIVIVLLLFIVFFFRKFSSFVYGVAILDIFFRILTFIKNNVGVAELKTLIGKYLPESIGSLIGKYSSDVFHTILMWAYVVTMAIFLGYVIKHFVKKRK